MTIIVARIALPIGGKKPVVSRVLFDVRTICVGAPEFMSVAAGIAASAKGASARGNTETTKNKIIKVDTVKPGATMSTPGVSTNVSKTTTLNVSWGGTDPAPASGILKYDVQYKTGLSGVWTNWKMGVTGTTAAFTGAAGNTYYFRSRSIDKAGNVGLYTSGTNFVVFPRNDGGGTYSTGWTTFTDAASPLYLGTVRYTSTAGNYMTMASTGSNAWIIVTKGPSRGSADVYVDGVYRTTINTYAASVAYRQVFNIGTIANPGVSHTVKVVNKATAGHPRIDIDGVAFKK